MGSIEYQPGKTKPDTQHDTLGQWRSALILLQQTSHIRILVHCRELTGVVYAIQQFNRTGTDHAADVNQKTRRERSQGEEGELLLIKKIEAALSILEREKKPVLLTSY